MLLLLLNQTLKKKTRLQKVTINHSKSLFIITLRAATFFVNINIWTQKKAEPVNQL